MTENKYVIVSDKFKLTTNINVHIRCTNYVPCLIVYHLNRRLLFICFRRFFCVLQLIAIEFLAQIPDISSSAL